MNRVPFARRTQIISCLVEGNSIRSTERITGTHRDTICRLLVEVGDGCAKLMNEQMYELSCRLIEVDEIWAYVGKKQRYMTRADARFKLKLAHYPGPPASKHRCCRAARAPPIDRAPAFARTSRRGGYRAPTRPG
jgi:hypothetical protein